MQVFSSKFFRKAFPKIDFKICRLQFDFCYAATRRQVLFFCALDDHSFEYLHQKFGNWLMQWKRVNLKTEVTIKQSTPNISKNEHFLSRDTHTYVCMSGGKKCSFFEICGVLYFLVGLVLKFAFNEMNRVAMALRCNGSINSGYMSTLYSYSN